MYTGSSVPLENAYGSLRSCVTSRAIVPLLLSQAKRLQFALAELIDSWTLLLPIAEAIDGFTEHSISDVAVEIPQYLVQPAKPARSRAAGGPTFLH